jgi:hypothetical protein
VTFLRRLLARGEPGEARHRHVREPGDGTPPGWDGVTDPCIRVADPTARSLADALRAAATTTQLAELARVRRVVDE